VREEGCFADSSKAGKKSMTAPVNDAGLRILIAEDYADNAVSMEMLLRMYGHDVAIAANGPTALEKARTDQPDVVLLDLGLPGMSGYDVARQLRDHRPRKRPLLIALSGFGQERDRQHSAEVGIDLHLVKPVAPEVLRAILEWFQQLVAKGGMDVDTCRPLPDVLREDHWDPTARGGAGV
jgi:CheY-like chemotaxis protein